MPPAAVQPTFRCALCGPASFANGQRRIECECAAGKSGLRVADNDVYVRCAGHCRQKLSIECLEAIATAAEKLKKELPAGRSIYDPNGIWAAILARVWRDDVDGAPHAAVFVKKTAHGLPAYFTKFCLLCDDFEIPEVEARVPAEFLAMPPDMDAPVYLPVVVAPYASDGSRGQRMVYIVQLIMAWPVAPTSCCRSWFKGLEGRREDVGGVCHPPPPPSHTRTVAPRVSSRAARLWPLALSDI
jgi:hypothetical protein